MYTIQRFKFRNVGSRPEGHALWGIHPYNFFAEIKEISSPILSISTFLRIDNCARVMNKVGFSLH